MCRGYMVLMLIKFVYFPQNLRCFQIVFAKNVSQNFSDAQILGCGRLRPYCSGFEKLKCSDPQALRYSASKSGNAESCQKFRNEKNRSRFLSPLNCRDRVRFAEALLA